MSAKVRLLKGRWAVDVHHASLPNGRKKKTVGDGPLGKKAAQRLAAIVNARIAEGKPPFPDETEFETARPALPFSEYALRWFVNEIALPQQRGMAHAVAEATVEAYQLRLRRLIEFFGTADLRAIDVRRIQAFVDDCVQTRRPPSTSSIDLCLSVLSQVVSKAQREGDVATNPVAVWKKSRPRRASRATDSDVTRRVLAPSEVAALLDAARTDFPQWFPLLLLLADSGLRLGEACALGWNDVDFANRVAFVHRSWSSGKRMGPTKSGYATNRRVVGASLRGTRVAQT